MKYLNLLLIFIPLAIATSLFGFDTRLVFASATLGIIPLAGILGRATEELALRAGPRVGGLLNATLGNAANVSLAQQGPWLRAPVYEKEESKWDGFQTPKSG